MSSALGSHVVGPNLFGRTRSALLALLYGHADQSFYLRQLVRAVGTGHGALQRELRHLLIIWLLQQAPIGSVEACPDRHSPKRSASFSPTLPRRKPASDIWQLVGGRMGSRVRDAGIRKPMSC